MISRSQDVQALSEILGANHLMSSDISPGTMAFQQQQQKCDILQGVH